MEIPHEPALFFKATTSLSGPDDRVVIRYVSQFMTLLPGDVISSATPVGVPLGMHPPSYLKPGDVVELGIDGLGSWCQLVSEWKA